MKLKNFDNKEFFSKPIKELIIKDNKIYTIKKILKNFWIKKIFYCKMQVNILNCKF